MAAADDPQQGGAHGAGARDAGTPDGAGAAPGAVTVASATSGSPASAPGPDRGAPDPAGRRRGRAAAVDESGAGTGSAARRSPSPGPAADPAPGPGPGPTADPDTAAGPATTADPVTAAGPVTAAEDELFVLTAAMLTPRQFPGVLGDDYPQACAGLGLSPVEAGYGLVFGQDGTGARWTVVTTDAAMVACALAAWDCGLEYDLSPGEATMAASLPGWPLPVAVAVPGLPEPFDPDEETGGGPPLAPPDTSAWGPAQRRLGADEIAVRWSEWRDRFEADSGATGAGSHPPAPDSPGERAPDPNPPGGPAVQPDPRGEPAAEAVGTEAGSAPPGAAAPARSPVRRVLDAAEEYLRTPPPPGRVRLAYGAVRADGPGWSLVGRTDDMAFVLVDEAPGHVLPVGVGPALPTLLAALSALASPPAARTV